MRRLPNQKYTKKFKEEAVKLVFDEKLKQVEAARRLQIPKETIRGWIRQYEETGTIIGKQQSFTTNDLESENARLRRELAEAKMERDILKKATAYFAKESR